MTGGPAAPDEAAPPVPGLLAEVRELTAAAVDDRAGALWRLAESGRQLDANLIRLPPDRRVDTHTEPDLDVLLVVVAGGGALHGGGRTIGLAEGALAWLPRGSTRSLAAGPGGLCYLTVHRRRPGMQIRSRPPSRPVTD